MSEDEWKSGNEDSSEESESDRNLKIRQDIPEWTNQLKLRDVGKFLFIIASCPLFDMDFRLQMMKDFFPKCFIKTLK